MRSNGVAERSWHTGLSASEGRSRFDGGEMTGCYNLGLMYEYGSGVDKRDAQRTMQLHQKACDGGIKASCQK